MSNQQGSTSVEGLRSHHSESSDVPPPAPQQPQLIAKHDAIPAGKQQVLSAMAKLWANRSKSNPEVQSFSTSDSNRRSHVKEYVYGHRGTLSAASPFLASVIAKHVQKNNKKFSIYFSDVDYDTLTQVFRWIYLSEVDDLHKHQLSLLAASEKFVIPSLRALCAESIHQTLPPEQAQYHLARMPLNLLPDLCLLMVFDSLPLKDVLTNVSLTCRRWNQLRDSVLVRRTRIGLKLTKDRDVYSASSCVYCTLNWCTRCSPYVWVDRPIAPENRIVPDLVWSVLTLNKVRRLVAVLQSKNKGGASRIRELVLTTDDDLTHQSLATSMNALVALLRSIATAAWPLDTIWFNTDSRPWPSFTRLIVPALEALPSLRHLFLGWKLIKDHVSHERPFAPLARLAHFQTYLSFGDVDEPDYVHLCRWIGANYRRNAHLRVLLPWSRHACFESIHAKEFDRISQSGAPLNQFTGFFPPPNQGSENNLEVVRRYYSAFTRLTVVSLGSYNFNLLSLAQITECLSGMTELRYLALSIDEDLVRCSQDHSDSTDDDTVQLYRTLPTVREFTLECSWYYEYYEGTLAPQWIRIPVGHIFPGLEVFRIKYYPSKTPEKRRLVRQLGAPFVVPPNHCVHLREIVLVKEKTGISSAPLPTESFTPEQVLQMVNTEDEE